MWHWQHKKIDKLAAAVYGVWGRLFLISFIGHIGFLFLIFFIYTDSIGILHLVVKKNVQSAAPILFMSNKKLGTKQVFIGSDKVSFSKTSKTKNKRDIKSKKEAKKSSSKKMPAKKMVIEKVPVKKISAEKTVTKKKMVPEKVAPEKIRAKKRVKNEKNRATVKPKKIVPEKIVHKKVTQKRKVKEKKAEQIPENRESALEKVPEKSLEENREKSIKGTSQEQALIINGQEYTDNNNTFLNNTLLDLKHENLRREIVREWAAPVGIDTDTGCTVKVGVDAQGKTNFFEIVVSSGILIFDISVQSICSSKQWPSWLNNTCFSMTFQ